MMLTKTKIYSSVVGVTLLIFPLFIYQYLLTNLPEIKTLKSVSVCLPMRIYTQEGELIAERDMNVAKNFISIDKIPPMLLKAFLAAEDRRFWEHKGVDFYGLLRATIKVLTNRRKIQGGSTITMQVARNFYLKDRQKTFLRKLKEIILARRIEKIFHKKDILELYLNKIYLGHGIFGVCSAAQLYFQKTLDQLTVEEMALLAGLPQAPSFVNPLANLEATQRRRNFVLKRMYQVGYLKKEDYEYALKKPVVMPNIERLASISGSYVSDLVQETIYKCLKKVNDQKVYDVYTTLSGKMQRSADQAIRKSLLDYDKRHGYRGPETKLPLLTVDNIFNLLDSLQKMPVINELIPSIVTECNEVNITVVLRNGIPIVIAKEGWNWIMQSAEDSITQYIQPGDVLRVYYEDQKWHVGQLPKVQAGLVAINAIDGAIKALSGGFSYALSPFNRAIYAFRQPGSVFKPFIYAAGLAKGYTLADVFNDAPLVFEVPGQENAWRPQNVTQVFQGLIRLRVAFVYSINSVTIRILQAIGFSYALQYVKRFGFETHKWPKNLSLALGTGEVSPMTMASAYAVFANGGYRVNPYLISHITDSHGNVLYRAEPAEAPLDTEYKQNNEMTKNIAKSSAKKKYALRVISPEVAFLVNSALQDVTRYGTGRLASKLGRSDIAGKTGTTNDRRDAWFIGYNNKLVTSVWVGHDQPYPLKEYASSVALPLWVDFMQPILSDLPEEGFVKPSTIKSASIDPKTGQLVPKETVGSILEYFQEDQLKKMIPLKVTKSHYRIFKAQDSTLKAEPLF